MSGTDCCHPGGIDPIDPFIVQKSIVPWSFKDYFEMRSRCAMFWHPVDNVRVVKRGVSVKDRQLNCPMYSLTVVPFFGNKMVFFSWLWKAHPSGRAQTLCVLRWVVCALRDPDTIAPVKLLLDSSDFFYQTPQSDRFFSQISPFHICQHLQFRIILNGPPPSLNRSNDWKELLPVPTALQKPTSKISNFFFSKFLEPLLIHDRRS